MRRYGKQTDTTFVAGDTVNVYAVRIGMSAKVAIAANSVLRSGSISPSELLAGRRT